MTVTSVPPVLPAESAPADPSTDTSTGSEAAQSGSRFASLLQGLHDNGDHADAAPPAKNAGAGRNPPGTKAPSSEPSADPALAALLHAYAGAVAPEARVAASAPDPAAASTPTNTDPANAANSAAATVAEILAAIAAATKPTAPAAGAPAPPTTPPDPTATATAPIAAAPTTDPALVASMEQALASAAGASVPAPPSTGSTTRATTSAHDTAPAPTAPTAPTAHTPAPTPAPAPAGTDAATVTAVAVAAGPNPVVRADAAPKQESANENALVTAASAAADHAPAASSAAAATAPAAPAAPLPPPAAEQLVAVLRPLHRAPDGTYQLRIEMRPPELGRVDMRVEMKDGVLHASIHAEHSETADLVRSALDELRSRLDADGVRSGQLTVDSQGAGTSGRDQQAATPDRLADPTTAITDPVAAGASTTTTNVTSDSLLDVRI